MRTLPLVLLGLFAARTAAATELSVRQLACPLGGGMVKVYEKVSANTLGGFDSDLAAYSTRGQFRTYAVATCADSLFSLLGSDMADPEMAERLRDPALAAKLQAALADELGRLASGTDPEPWERYALAARAYRELGATPLFLAELYLQASWTARDAAVGVVIGIEGPAGVARALAEGEDALAGPLPPETRRTLLFNLARVAHRGGLGAARDRYLEAFAESGPLDGDERAALARLRRIAHEVEPVYQDLAIAAFTEGLRVEGLEMAAKIRATYLLADLLRRRGRDREALGLYGLVLAEAQAPMNLREMALLLSRELAGDP